MAAAIQTRSYDQICPLAWALDVLGERWTLLVVRELLLGPKRFKTLLAALPAMGTTRLSSRLKALTRSGVIQAVSEPFPAYELTALGEQLRRPLLSLGVWGVQLMPLDDLDPDGVRPELIALALTGAADPLVSAGVSAVWEFLVGESRFHILVSDGEMLARSGPSPESADIVLNCDTMAFVALVLGRITVEAALANGALELSAGGPEQAVEAFGMLQYRA